MLRRQSYLAAARELRRLADALERYAGASSPRARASLTSAINRASRYARELATRHRRSLERGAS